MGWPESFVGVKRARYAACTDTSRSMPGPDRARAETTFPFSSTMTSTSTIPTVRILRAASGYVGGGRLTALLLSTPPDTGFIKGSGGGGLSVALTIGWLVFVEPARSVIVGCAVGRMVLPTTELVGGKAAANFFSLSGRGLATFDTRDPVA